MTQQENEFKDLKQSILDMLSLTKTQLEKAKKAFLEKDDKLASEIIVTEKEINNMELAIDEVCENLIACFQPVASDLRFVISMLKINSDIERIADYADGIADYILDLETPIPKTAIKAVNIEEMFNITISMISDIHVAIKDENSVLAKEVYNKDKELNSLNSNASKIIKDFIIKTPDATRRLLFLFSVVRKLERVGDHIKNIAEDIIFYIEVEILKHRDTK